MQNNPPQLFSLKGLCRSFGFAMQGIAYTVKTQRNARLHILAALIACGLGLWLNISMSDWRWLLLSIALVWFAELINTAFEYLCDVVMPDLHPSVKRAKDIAAGAVMVCAVMAVLIGIMTLWPYMII